MKLLFDLYLQSLLFTYDVFNKDFESSVYIVWNATICYDMEVILIYYELLAGMFQEGLQKTVETIRIISRQRSEPMTKYEAEALST